MRVVAEGVETAGQLSELRRMGCDVVQGYYLAKPQPAADVLALLSLDSVEPVS
jgi:EAL domain-containing protein (putative c-di-GMP-specific phosphodiesterase class I)